MPRGGARPGSGRKPDGHGARKLVRTPLSLIEATAAYVDAYNDHGTITEPSGRERPARPADVHAAALALGLEELRARGLQAGLDAFARSRPE